MAQCPWPRPWGCQVPPAPRILRLMPRRAGWAGHDGKEGTGGSPRPSLLFRGSWGAFHQHTYSVGPRQTEARSFGSPERGGGKWRALLELCGWDLLWGAGQKCWSEGTGAFKPRWQPLTLGRRRAGLQRLSWGQGEAQQTPTPPKCIPWRKSISSGEQIECIKLAWNQRSVQMYLNRLSQMECASFEGRLLLLSSLP